MTTPAQVIAPAVSSWSDAQTVTANVSTPEYPGPVTGNHAGGSKYERPGGPQGPPSGSSSTVAWFETATDLGDVLGDPTQVAAIAEADVNKHASTIAAFDSNAGIDNQMGSGPIAAGVHARDTGGEQRKFHVNEPSGRGWWRRTLTGQTYSQQAQVTDNRGWDINSVNDRRDLDQYQGHDADASHPRWIPYSERPLKLNIAHEPVAFGRDTTGAYAPGGELGPVGPQFWTDSSSVYQTPPDPSTEPPVQDAAVATSAVGFWG